VEIHSSIVVARRVLALLAVSSRAIQPTAKVDSWVEHNQIEQLFSNDERRFFSYLGTPDPQTVINFSWRSEAVVALLWALGGFQSMPSLAEQASLAELPFVGDAFAQPEVFVRNAKLRPLDELVEMEDHLYHQHWRVRDAQLLQRPTPAELHAGVVIERRYALSWLVGGCEDWDNVPTDT